jgi:hypothetical protein
MSGRQGFITNHQTYVYQESPSTGPADLCSAAMGLDNSATPIWRLLVKADDTAYIFTSGQFSIDPSTDGNITLDPNGAGNVTIASGGLTITAGGLTVTAGNTTLTPLANGTSDYAAVISNASGVLSAVTAVAGTTGQVLTSQGHSAAPIWATAGVSGVSSITGDSGGALVGALTLAGGAGCTTPGSGTTLTIDVDKAQSAMTSVDFANAGRIGTGTTAADTLLISAYDVDGTAYVPFITLTANNTPTMDLASAVTIGSAYIYRAAGTDVAVADGGTGASTLTIHGLLVGNATTAINAMAAGTAGQIVTSGGASADPVWTTATYPATVTKGDVLVASANNIVDVVAGATTSGYVLTANGAGTAPTFQAASGGGIGTLAGDSGTATGATVTIAGGTNITTTAGTATLTVNLDAALTGLTSVTGANGYEIRTGTTAADTLLLRAYDVDGTAYVTFATLTANDTPTMDLATGVTIGSAYIYRASGTDVAVADGGTGASTLTQNGVLYGNATSAVGITAEGGTGTILVGTTSAAPSWLATGAEGKVLTSHNGSALTWETPGAGTTWLTKADATANATATVNYSYTINHATPANLLTITLPATAAVGDRVEIVGNTAGMWSLVAATGDTIKVIGATTSAGGSVSATVQYDCIEVVCTVADTTWVACKSMGNLTIA